MLNRIKLTNFQRHRSLEVDFSPGMTAIRGANEAGKSTMLRGVCYGWFGVKGLGAAIDELVTWGEDVKTLKVEFDFTVDGILYSVKRGKSGAELRYDGGVVTGQNEVTNFVSKLLGCDPVAATRLMLANQDDLRGTLEAGANKTAELIERLTDFDQIDNLVELMAEKLTTGATATVEAAIATAQAQLDAARDAAVAPDLPMLDHRIEDMQEAVSVEQGRLQQAQDKVDAAVQAFNDAKVTGAERDGAQREISQYETRIEEIDRALPPLRETKAPDNAVGRIDDLRRRIAAAEDRGALIAKMNKVAPYLRPDGAPVRDSVTEQLFHGTLAELEAALDSARSRRDINQREAADRRQRAALARQAIQEGSCSFCGIDLTDLPQVKVKNAELLEDAEGNEEDAAALEQGVADEQALIQHLTEIRAASQPILKALDVVGDVARLGDGRLPPYLVWTGPDVAKSAGDPADLRLEISQIERQQADYVRASAKLETLEADRAKLETNLAAARARLAALPVVDMDALRQARDDARDALRPLQDAAQQAQNALLAAQRAKVDAVGAYEAAKASVEAAKAALATRRAELVDLEFNNALVKRVRQCRPLISDKLWKLVLSSVSAYFSEIRGQKSKVTKTGDGFQIDGHPVSGVSTSGSTLDALGLAIRVALVRTFLPGADFLVVDEPAAACDDSRTNNMLGFIAGAGFKQVLLVTHEDVSQAVCDHVITVGAS